MKDKKTLKRVITALGVLYLFKAHHKNHGNCKKKEKNK